MPLGNQLISRDALLRALSPARLQTYQHAAGESMQTVFGRYRWNRALCAALSQDLADFEVCLRNSVHCALSQRHRRDDWYVVSPTWLKDREQDAIAEARASILRDGKSESPDRIVAELSFGFWSGLLRRDYEADWRPLLREAFPHMPRSGRTRAAVADRVHLLRRLRNRVSHLEPVYNGGTLVRTYDQLREAISWIAPELLTVPPIGDDFLTIHARGPTAYEVPVSEGPANAGDAT